jgi:hypothetical protein
LNLRYIIYQSRSQQASSASLHGKFALQTLAWSAFHAPNAPKKTKQSVFVCFHVFMPVVSTKRGARAATAINSFAVFQISVCARANAESLCFDFSYSFCPKDFWKV